MGSETEFGDGWDGDLGRLFRTFLVPDQGNNVYKATFKTLAMMKGLPEDSVVDAMKHAETLPAEFNTSAELAAFLEPIRTSQFVKTHWPKAGNALPPSYGLLPVGVNMPDGFEIGNGAATDTVQRLMGFAHNGFAGTKFVALHELAHLIQSDEFGVNNSPNEDASGHGPIFARINLMLVEEVFGKDIAKKLENEMFLATVYVAPRSKATRA